jgi:Protein of unknown function (DUF3421)
MSDAIVACHDPDGDPVYIGRAHHDLELLPAKVVPAKYTAFVTHDGCEYPKYGVEVLCGGQVHWAASSFEQVPAGAVVGGQTSNGENLYIGRGIHGSHMFLGKIQPSLQRLFISAGDGYEVALRFYDILVEDDVPNDEVPKLI